MSSVSRRDLLASASIILISAASDAAFGTAPGADNGRINLGLAGVTNFWLFYQFINIWKSAGDIQVIADGTAHSTRISPGMPNSAWDKYIDRDGELVRPLPGRVAQVIALFLFDTA